MEPQIAESHPRERSALFDPAVIWALGVQTHRQCIRRKVLLVLGIFVAVLLVGAPLIPSFRPDERVRLLISLCLWSMTFFAIVIAVFLAATAIPEDRQEQTIVTVLTKPVGRFNYLLGRIFGFALTLGLILLVMGVISVIFLRISSVAAPDIVLTGKRGIEPVDVHARIGGRKEPARRSEIDKNRVVLRRFGPSDEALVFTFRPDVNRFSGDNVTLELTPFIAAGIQQPNTAADITVRRRGTASMKPVTFHRTLNSEFTTAVSFPRDLIDPVEGVDVAVRRENTQTFVRLAMSDVQLMVAPMPFELSLFKGILALFSGVMLVVVIAVTASTFLSGWVAVLASFSAYFFAEFNQTLREYMTALKEHAGFLGMAAVPVHHHGPPIPPKEDTAIVHAVNQVFRGLLWLVTHIVPDFSRFKTASFLASSRDVPLTFLGWAVLFAAIYGTCFIVLGQLVFWKRELLS